MDSASKAPWGSSPILLVSVGFVVGAIVDGAFWLSSRDGAAARTDFVRNVTVDYMYETNSDSASGHKGLEVDTIAFLPGYVVMTDKRGNTQLLAVNRMRRFNYKPSGD